MYSNVLFAGQRVGDVTVPSMSDMSVELYVLLPLSICMIMHLSMFDVLIIFLHFICRYMFMGLVSRMSGV